MSDPKRQAKRATRAERRAAEEAAQQARAEQAAKERKQQTIIGCGAGTTTKRLFAEENRIERCENVKDVEQYISRVEEMIERKEKLLSDAQ